MRPRHAAALALAGWYLMVPPISHKGEFLDNAPLSEWTLLDSTDSAADCNAEANRSDLRSKTERDRNVKVDHTKCISTDDPRLKGN